MQNQPQNTVISIRINSPGNNGAIVQQNLTVSVSSSGNVSVTGQQQGPPEVSADDERHEGAAHGIAHESRHQADQGQRRHLERQGRPSVGAEGLDGGGRACERRLEAGRRLACSDSTSAPAAPVVSRDEGSHATRSSRATHRLVPRQMAGAARHLAAVPHNAADVLRNLAPRPPVQASDGGQNVSSAVVLTLVAVLGAFAVLFASTLMGRAPQVFGRWNWRLR